MHTRKKKQQKNKIKIILRAKNWEKQTTKFIWEKDKKKNKSTHKKNGRWVVNGIINLVTMQPVFCSFDNPVSKRMQAFGKNWWCKQTPKYLFCPRAKECCIAFILHNPKCVFSLKLLRTYICYCDMSHNAIALDARHCKYRGCSIFIHYFSFTMIVQVLETNIRWIKLVLMGYWMLKYLNGWVRQNKKHQHLPRQNRRILLSFWFFKRFSKNGGCLIAPKVGYSMIFGVSAWDKDRISWWMKTESCL